MAETRDPSSPEKRAGSSGIPLHRGAVAESERRARRPSEVPLTRLTEGTEDIAVRDRALRVFCRRLLGSSAARSAQVDDAVDGVIARPLEIPPLTARAQESHRLLQEALDEAAAALATARIRIARQARQGVLDRVASFAELEKTALRIVALAATRNPSQAAVRLGIAPVSLKRWLHHRPWLRAVLGELRAYRFHADD